jgi:hypothetical protein
VELLFRAWKHTLRGLLKGDPEHGAGCARYYVCYVTV